MDSLKVENTNHELLNIMLEAAVPLAIEDILKAGGRDAITDYQLEQVREYSDQLGGEGDTLLYYTKHKTAQNFSKLTECLAIMAFMPGGVKISGLHFEVKE